MFSPIPPTVTVAKEVLLVWLPQPLLLAQKHTNICPCLFPPCLHAFRMPTLKCDTTPASPSTTSPRSLAPTSSLTSTKCSTPSASCLRTLTRVCAMQPNSQA
eukprot:Pompholyxophrys_sp_v1_NODE_629_length_421_cov_14.377049.p3 type:complete len:102 gc:universal NODE_629_length_421_cov_14.377049:30-335(+)